MSTMTKAEAEKAIMALGYDLARRSNTDAIYVALTDEGGPDDPPSEADVAIEELRAALPGLSVEWTGDSDTDGDGYTTSDVRIAPEAGEWPVR